MRSLRLPSLPARRRTRRQGRFTPRVEQLEARNLLAASLASPPLDDVPEGTFRMIVLDASGAAAHAGQIDYPGDTDLYGITATLTGEVTIKVDLGLGSEQVITLMMTRGQTQGFLVSSADPDAVLPYQITISTIVDDFPERTRMFLDADGAAVQPASIDFPSDVDVFRFRATVSGLMTVWMSTSPESGLLSHVDVTGASVVNEFFPRPGVQIVPASDHLIQFEVVAGQRYDLRASGLDGSRGAYQLRLFMAADDYTAPEPITGGSKTGGIQFPGDQDVFFFTALVDGHAILQLNAAVGSVLKAQLTPDAPIVYERYFDSGYLTSSTDVAPSADHIVVIEVQAGVTYQLVVSARNGGIGDYELRIDQHDPIFQADFLFQRRSHAPHMRFDESLAILFRGNGAAPIFDYQNGAVAPVGDGPPPTPTRLTPTVLPIAEEPPPPPPGLPGSSVPVPAAIPPSSLVATLLGVAARDNAVSAAQARQAVSFDPSTAVVSLAPVELRPGRVPEVEEAGTENSDISGIVFDDCDADGTQRSGEPGREGESVVLESSEDGRWLQVAEAVTDEQGHYAFRGVKPGNYRVRLILGALPASILTTPGHYEVKVDETSADHSCHFGKRPRRGAALPSSTDEDDLGAGLPLGIPGFDRLWPVGLVLLALDGLHQAAAERRQSAVAADVVS